MSYEIARQIIARRTARNKQRIQGAVQTAYNEALQEYKSEEEARKAAIKVLKQEQDLLKDYRKDLEKARLERIKGNIGLMKANAIQAKENKEAKAKWLQQERLILSGYTDRELGRAKDHASKSVYGEGEYEDFEKALVNINSKLMSEIASNPEEFESLFQSAFVTTGNSRDAIKEFNRPKPGSTLLTESDIAGQKQDRRFVVENQTYAFLNKYNIPLGSEQAKLVWKKATGKEQPEYTKEQIYQKYEAEKDAYLDDKGLPREQPYPIEEEPIPTLEASKYEKDLVLEAEPIFRRLRETNATPFELSQEEMMEIQGNADLKKAYTAYLQLQKLIPNKPELVTREQELLLDKIALQRQLDIYKTEQKIGKMQPHMKSRESINRRALEIADPKRSKNQELAMLSPTAQKFYATQKNALNLSDKSDAQLLNGTIGEKTGMLLYKQHFDPVKKTYRDGSNYDSVVSEIENQFSDPESQLQAIAAFNSRAMALQRSSNPIILPDGKEDKHWLEALKALSKKS